jgi:hypothetical protein
MLFKVSEHELIGHTASVSFSRFITLDSILHCIVSSYFNFYVVFVVLVEEITRGQSGIKTMKKGGEPASRSTSCCAL